MTFHFSTRRVAEVTRDGTWSQWQGEWDRFETTLERLPTARVAEEHDVDAIVEAISEALEKSAGGGLGTAKATAEERAARARAAVAALHGREGGEP